MKLLFDENLSPHLTEALSDIYPDSTHVAQCGLQSADDATVWRYAMDHGFTIVSKDSDFQEMSVLRGAPPKLVWLRVSNCTTSEIESLLRAAASSIRRFVEQNQESCLALAVRPPAK